jgi:hypothetical protein
LRASARVDSGFLPLRGNYENENLDAGGDARRLDVGDDCGGHDYHAQRML